MHDTTTCYRLDRSLTALRACVCEPGPGTPTELLRRCAVDHRRAGVAEEQLQREGDDDEGGGGGQPAAARSRRVHGSSRLVRVLCVRVLPPAAWAVV